MSSLPEAPTDIEKKLFLKMNVISIAIYQLFSVIFMFAGITLFIYSDIIFIVYLPYALFLVIYFIISFYCNVFGKDFDYQNHLKLKDQIEINSESPSIDIYLPCCGESLELLENTYKFVNMIDYPNYKVYILDDKELPEIKELALKYSFNYISRPNKPYLKKSGNLRYAFNQTNGQFYLVLDADFCPRHDILKEMIIYMIDNPKIAIVQSPQYFRVNKNQNWVERGAGLVQELFYRIIQINRDRFGACICVGTSALYRREALITFGGTAEIEHSEDLHTGFNVINLGYSVKYISLILSMGICPDTLKSFFNQQYRWSTGSTSLLYNKEFWNSKLTFNQKLCYISGMMYYIISSFDMLLNPTYSILLVFVRPQFMLWYNLGFIIPSLFFFTVVYSVWSQYDYKFSFDVLKIQIIQSYSHLFAIIDKIMGRTVGWVATNEKIKSKNNNFLLARLLLISYTFTCFGLLLGGSIYRSFEYQWYNFLPPNLLMVYHIFLSYKFMFNIN